MSLAPHILENAQLAADRGWKASFFFQDGTAIHGAYITACDWEQGAVAVERVGERHLQPTLIFLKDLSKVEVDWA
ncbi:MAG TPA: hypothetical protein VFV50_17480 [Bdellovibrionales bacterium]|nr:hypothetical protein [Bdellovibrionales bacterium]